MSCSRRTLLLSLAALAFPGALPAQRPAARPAPPSALAQRVEAAVREEMKKQGIPGLSIAILRDGKLLLDTGYGMADVENSVPAAAWTNYRLGSISKSVTAVAVMQLAQQGKIDLDADIRRYAPEFPEKQWPVTVRQLLGHLGGVRHYRGAAELNSTKRYARLADALEQFKDDPLLHEPGTKYSYTTYGYTLLGLAVERASGKDFVSYLRDHVWKPAGITTMRPDSVADIIPHRAQGYTRLPGGPLRNSALADISNKIPGGGLCSRTADLVRFGGAVMNGTLVSRETMDLMFTPLRTADGKATSYGLGWANATTQKRGRAVEHGGGQPRITTLLFLQPERKLAIGIMCNLERANLRRLLDPVFGIVTAAAGAK